MILAPSATLKSCRLTWDAITRHAIRNGLVFIILIVLSAGFADGIKLYVPESYPGIQDAIDAATDGDEILVHGGEYQDSLIINKSISLIGVEATSGIPVIIPKVGENAIALFEDGITMKGFKVMNEIGNAETCIYIDSDNDSISDMVLLGCLDRDIGIFLNSNMNNTIYNCTLEGMERTGIYLLNSSGNKIYNNIISICQYGIHLSESSKNQLRCNTFSKNIYGIMYESDFEEAENDVKDNDFPGTNTPETKHEDISNP